jgi:phosphoribosyl 1,2-cyclic phosphodiesterase
MSGADPSICPASPDNPTGLSVTFWGVRGSAPVSGPGYEAFGGSTMCLELAADGHRLILDAGSGLRKVGLMLQDEEVLTVDILLTHFHMDHLMGLMTFAPLFQKGAVVTIYAPVLMDILPEATLDCLLNTPYSPIKPNDTGASVVVKSFCPGETITVSGLAVQTIRLSHPGGACGYRVAYGGQSVAVIIDHEHVAGQPEQGLVEFCSGVGLLLYDAPWDEAIDYEPHRGWGHSTWQAGLRLMHAADARCLGCLHHAPEATDDILFGREAQLRQQHPPSFLAREGETVRLASLGVQNRGISAG